MKKSLVYLSILLLIVFVFANFNIVGASSAQDLAKTGLDNTNAEIGLAQGDPARTVGAALGVLLSVLGLVFLIICIYAGVLWMTAAGEKDNIAKARSMLIQGAIGLIITLGAYTVTAYVVDKITGALN